MFKINHCGLLYKLKVISVLKYKASINTEITDELIPMICKNNLSETK